ncbi:uncharacterized protein LOC116027597 [Ipomoea triloba]|uniref:uncharacterized protein LOC116027597 n=1 Tax=Ipomoea triloba TaxID=35885 RepID=UPI00125E6699|nr:uncharacterized protein LOC116027597 [Ipomoea triloba]
MRQPPGYEDPAHPDNVCHLQGFPASKTDVSLFNYSVQETHVCLLIYVDNIIMMGNDSGLSSIFKIRDFGTPNFFLGIETLLIAGGMLLSQRRYMEDILHRAGMTNCKLLTTPAALTQTISPTPKLFENTTQYRRLAGALQYLTITPPNLSYAINRLNMH